MLLISGPGYEQGKYRQQSVKLLEGYHTVPKKLHSTLSSGFLIGHENAGTSSGNEKNRVPPDQETNREGEKKKNKSISVFFGSMKDHQNIVYMFFASVGIPLFIIALCYFEVHFLCLF